MPQPEPMPERWPGLVVIDHKIASALTGRSTEAIRALIQRKKLSKGQVVIAGTSAARVHKGIDLWSLVQHEKWTEATLAKVLEFWGVDVDHLHQSHDLYLGRGHSPQPPRA